MQDWPMPAPPSCFAALPVPPTPAIDALQAALPPELRPIHPADLHVTVAYFGRVDPALQPRLRDALARLVFEGTHAALGGLLVLPSRERSTSITLGLAPGPGREAVVALMNEHRDRLRALADLPAEGWPPLPHVTIARPRGKHLPRRGPIQPAARAAILAWVDATPTPAASLPLGRVVLMRSRPPGGPGPHYEVV